jgi:hypothetical protein
MSDSEKNKSWFAKHKFLTVVLVIIALVIIGGALSGDESSDTSSTSGNSTSENGDKEYRFDNRADKQASDVEVLPGETATISDVSMTLDEVNYATSLDEFQDADPGNTYVVANVTIVNNSDSTQPYNVFDFRIQTAGGQVLDGSFSSVDNSLSSGDLVSGGTVSGNIVFEVPVEEDSQYVIWKPSAFGSDRAIVQVQ